MPIYNLIEYSNDYSKISGILRQYYRGDDLNENIPEPESFKFNVKITGSTGNKDNKIFKIAVPLTFLNNFGELLKSH